MPTTVRLVRDLLTDAADDPRGGVPYLPELPARGPGADLIGRTAGALVEMPVDLQPSGWRLVDRAGRDAERTEALMRHDLDQLAEAFDGYQGDLKVQLAGPWTLAASVRLARGERALADAGALRDLVSSLAEGASRHLDRVHRLVPGAELLLQLDEPLLPEVLGGRLPTSSGYGHLAAVDPVQVAAGLAEVLAAAGARTTVLHCCADVVPLPVIRQAGPDAVALDIARLGPSGWESVAATVESGLALWAGVIRTDASAGTQTSFTEVADRLQRSWREVGLPLAGLGEVVLTPACGMAGLSPQSARATQQQAVDAAGALTERVAG